MGITNELFQDERDENPELPVRAAPNTVTNIEADDQCRSDRARSSSSRFFMRFLAPPSRRPTTPGGAASIAAGRQTLQRRRLRALPHAVVHDRQHDSRRAGEQAGRTCSPTCCVHDMGPELADEVSQGQAGGDEFRTAPLWGLGQRIFFLHDGRTTDLIEAIRAHRSAGNATFGPSEANASVDAFNALSESSKQNLLNFLRSL